MSSSGIVAYNPSSVTQQDFLSSLALGETGNNTNAWTTGYGGANLSGAALDANGFPIWQGLGNSQAAGAFQFQPSTWAGLAQTYGLNFQNPSDQQAGAWYLAQQTYAQNTGGGSLINALKSGQFSSIQAALKNVWPSVTGSGSAPQGLANDLAQGLGSSNITGTTPAQAANAGTAAANTASSASSSGTGLVATIDNFFVRGGLIIAGGIIIVIALWYALGKPSPTDIVRKAL